MAPLEVRHTPPPEETPRGALLIADLHSDLARLRRVTQRLGEGATDRVLLGDSGFDFVAPTDWGSLSLRPWPGDPVIASRPWTLVPGNHDDYRVLAHASTHGVPPGWTWWPRGQGRTLAGWQVLAIGGGDSSPEQRHEGRDWWPARETVSLSLIEDLIAHAPPPDLLLLHTPPARFYHQQFGPSARVSRTSRHLELLCQAWPEVPWLAGHCHGGGMMADQRGLVIARHEAWELEPRSDRTTSGPRVWRWPEDASR